MKWEVRVAGIEPHEKGLRMRNRPMCTLSQNGYGADSWPPSVIGHRPSQGKPQTKDRGRTRNNTEGSKPKISEREGEDGGGRDEGGGRREGRRREDVEGDGRKGQEKGTTEKGEKGRK